MVIAVSSLQAAKALKQRRQVDFTGRDAADKAAIDVERMAVDIGGGVAVEEASATPVRALSSEAMGRVKTSTSFAVATFSKSGIIGVSVGPGQMQLMRTPAFMKRLPIAIVQTVLASLEKP